MCCYLELMLFLPSHKSIYGYVSIQALLCTLVWIIVALFIIAKNRSSPNVLSPREWISKMWCIHIIKYYSASKWNGFWNMQQNTQTSEVKEARHKRPHVVICILYWYECSKSQTSRDRTLIGGCLGLGMGNRINCRWVPWLPLGWWQSSRLYIIHLYTYHMKIVCQ